MNHLKVTDLAGEEAGPAVNGKRKKLTTSRKSSKSKVQKLDVCFLDQTSVHPESYHIASEYLSSDYDPV
jgi:hypothetical protein